MIWKLDIREDNRICDSRPLHDPYIHTIPGVGTVGIGIFSHDGFIPDVGC